MALATLDFKEALANFPAGVVIVTSATRSGQPVGATVSSFCSLSLDPPLVIVCLNRGSRSAAAIQERRAYAVHILCTDQESLAYQFAADGREKFDAAPYGLNADGVPCLTDCGLRLDCELEAEHHGGDHVILVGRVVAVESGGDFEPLVYARRSFFALGQVVA